MERAADICTFGPLIDATPTVLAFCMSPHRLALPNPKNDTVIKLI